jgi:hypothetical protein
LTIAESLANEWNSGSGTVIGRVLITAAGRRGSVRQEARRQLAETGTDNTAVARPDDRRNLHQVSITGVRAESRPLWSAPYLQQGRRVAELVLNNNQHPVIGRACIG